MLSQKHTLREWLDYVEAQHPQSVIELGLGRMRTMVERLGIEFDCPVIVVGGTNGKGSTCMMLESIYRAAGYEVGTHTSPHMLRFNERARVNGAEIDDESMVRAFERVEAKRGDLPLTYFEFTALAIFMAFIEKQLDVVILEVGLGGRLDAINVLEPTASIVTTVGVDHEAFLGNTRDSVGWEKAHIYRKGKPAICADRKPPAKLVQYALGLGASLRVYGDAFDVEESGDQLTFKMGELTWTLPRPALYGRNQIDNASGVLAMIASLLEYLPVTEGQIAQGLRSVRLTGRFECRGIAPLLYLDVGHNPHAALVLAENLKTLPAEGKTIAVFGMLADKDMQEVIEIVRPMIDEWYVAGLPPPRGANLALLVRTMREAGVEAHQIIENDSVVAALQKARENASINDKIIVFGSFVTVTDVLPLL